MNICLTVKSWPKFGHRTGQWILSTAANLQKKKNPGCCTVLQIFVTLQCTISLWVQFADLNTKLISYP